MVLFKRKRCFFSTPKAGVYILIKTLSEGARDRDRKVLCTIRIGNKVLVKLPNAKYTRLEKQQVVKKILY